MKAVIEGARAFITKFANDWAMNLAGLLAYNFLGAIFPLLLGILAVAALVLPEPMVQQLGREINGALPPQVRQQGGANLGATVLGGFRTVSGLTAVASFAGLIWTGSNLFSVMENCFSIIYRTGGRPIIRQKLVALAMVALFTLLAPLALLASGISGSFSTLAHLLTTAPGIGGVFQHVPGLDYIFGLGGYAIGVGFAFLLFYAIYFVVPNVKLGFGHAWPGAVVAALLFEGVNLIFPVYGQRFLSGRFGSIVLLLAVLTLWFWVISLILVLGAEINAFLTLGKRPLKVDLAGAVQALECGLGDDRPRA